MRSSLLLFAALTGSGIVAACGSSNGSPFQDGNGTSSGATSNGGPINTTPIGSSGADPDGGSSGNTATDALDIDQASIRIEPIDAVLTVDAGKQVTQSYKVFGKTKSSTAEEDLTTRFVFYVPDNFLVGGFPKDGAAVFTSRLPSGPTDYPQRAGKLTVQARGRNSNGEVKVTTSLTVKLNAKLESPNASPSLPSKPEDVFKGPTSDLRKPELVYPNNGVMLPPNLRRLEVHWKPGSTDNRIYEIRFSGTYSDIVYYSRCITDATKPLYEDDACAFELDGTGYGYLAESNRGTGPVKLKIRGTDDAGTAVGESAEFTIEFAESRVDGGLYYWQVSDPTGIMRFDFGAPSGDPEAFINTQTNPTEINQCAGCHAISRNGQKLVASLGGQNDGRLIFIGDLSKKKTDPDWLTIKPNSDPGYKNRIQFASWNPDSTKFVAVYGDKATSGGGDKPIDVDLQRNYLFFHDGTTGLRIGSKKLDFKPDHPDWSPNGEYIAVTHVDESGVEYTSQRPKNGSIDLLQKSDADPSGFGAPANIVGVLANANRFNPNFVPDSSFLYYTESHCDGPADSTPSPCDGDADWTATTWATKPIGGTPIHLDNAAKPGVADGSNTNLGDTFPRSAPFRTTHRGGELFWFTVASRRAYGLRKVGGAQHLWMFAIDPAKINAGTDGSFPGFFLPFQDLTKSNHIGQWTERIVGGAQPPPEPPPVAPEPPDLPPPVIK